MDIWKPFRGAKKADVDGGVDVASASAGQMPIPTMGGGQDLGSRVQQIIGPWASQTITAAVSSVSSMTGTGDTKNASKQRPRINGDAVVTKRDKNAAWGNKMRPDGGHGGPGDNGDLLIAAMDLYREERSGHLPSFAYSSPQFEGDLVRGMETWPKLARSPDYYLYWDEVRFLEEKSDAIASFLPANLKNISMIEMGTGAADIVKKKTHALIKAFERVKGEGFIKDYIAMDVNEKYAKDAARLTGQEFDIREDYIVSDFRREGLRVETEATPVMIVFGGTLFNLPKIKDAKPHHILQTYLEYLRDIIGEGGYLIITQDVNTDEKSLMKAYDDEKGYGRKTAMSIMHRMERDLKTQNFSGHDFDCKVEWIPAESRITMKAVAKKDKHFSIGDMPFRMRKGQEWSLLNAFKMSAESFKECANFAGYDYVNGVAERKNGRIVGHVLRVR